MTISETARAQMIANKMKSKVDAIWNAMRTGRLSNLQTVSLNQYREIEHDAVEHEVPADILSRLREMERDIFDGLEELGKMVDNDRAKMAAE